MEQRCCVAAWGRAWGSWQFPRQHSLNMQLSRGKRDRREDWSRAYRSNDGACSALTEATETGGHYYTLSYSPSNQKYDGRLRLFAFMELAKRGYCILNIAARAAAVLVQLVPQLSKALRAAYD